MFFKGSQRRALFAGKRCIVQCLIDLAKLPHTLPETLGGPSSGGSGVIEFVRQPGGEFAERAQLVALLFCPAVLSDSIGENADQPWKKLRNALEHFLKLAFAQSQNPGGLSGPNGQREVGHAGEGQHAENLAGPSDKAGAVRSPVFTTPADLTFKQNEQRIRRIAFVRQRISGRDQELLGARREPLQLIFAKIRKYRNPPQCGFEWLSFR